MSAILRLAMLVAVAYCQVGCAGRRLPSTGSGQPWQVPRVIDAVCRGGIPSLYEGPFPLARYQVAVVVDTSRNGEVADARVVDRWPSWGWCEPGIPPFEEVQLEWIRKQWTFSPALRDGRPARGAGIWVLGIPDGHGDAPPAVPLELLEESCDFVRPEVLAPSHEAARRWLGDLASWEGYQATVLVEVTERGTVSDARIIQRKPDSLDPQERPWSTLLLAWAKEVWRFQPAMRGGTAEATTALIQVDVPSGTVPLQVNLRSVRDNFLPDRAPASDPARDH